jgi:hypothetical protein
LPAELDPGQNASPFQGAAEPPAVTPETAADEQRARMTVWARWAIQEHAQFTYTEGPGRSHMVESSPGSLPQSADCSAFCTGLAKWAGAPDPNGLNFSPVGYTGTLLEHCTHIEAGAARMGDLIVYGPGTGAHAVYILERLPDDFACASHGQPGDPSRVLHSALLAYFHDVATFLRWLPA